MLTWERFKDAHIAAREYAELIKASPEGLEFWRRWRDEVDWLVGGDPPPQIFCDGSR